MRYVHHTVVLHGERAGQGRVHLLGTGLLLQHLYEHVERSVLMRFRGRSRLKGRRPLWLERVMDIRLVGVENQGGAVLHFEAPTFGEAAAELYQQLGLWELRPDPGWTGFETYADVLRDLWQESADSDLYDRSFLRAFRPLGKPLFTWFESLRLEDRRGERDTSVLLTRHTLRVAERLGSHVPGPHPVRLVGVVDMLRASTQSFALRLPGGERVRCMLAEGDCAELAPLFGERVQVEGRAVYRASGRLLRVDAASVEPLMALSEAESPQRP